VPPAHVPELRQWSQAIVRMYEPTRTEAVVDAAVRAATDFADLVRELAEDRAARPQSDLLTDLVAARDEGERLSPDEVVASAVLLLNAGHEASVNVFGNGLVAMLTRGALPAPGEETTCVEEMLRFDSALQLFERTAKTDLTVAGMDLAAGDKVAVLLGAANRDPVVFDQPDVFDPRRDPNPHLAFGAGLHFCLGAPLARMELVESLGLLLSRFPQLRLQGDPKPRGTFVLRGFEVVSVGG